MKNRFIITLCSICIHISIGSIYAWSQIAASIKQQLSLNWSIEQLTISFSISILCLGLSSAFLGHIVEKVGPKISGFFSALLIGLGFIGTSFAIQYENLLLLYATYGVLGGIGMGIGYIIPTSTLLKWYPKTRGFAMGMIVMGFGFGGAIAIYILQYILPAIGIFNIATQLIILGYIYAFIIFFSSLFITPPQKNYSNNKFQKNIPNGNTDLTAYFALKTTHFYYLWIMFFINSISGITIISVAKFIGMQTLNLTSQMASIMVMLMSIFNGLGRITWATISDKISRPITYTLFFVLQITSFLLLMLITNKILFQILIFLILSCYGGGFALIPAFVGDLFGTKEASTIHGFLLTAPSIAVLIGPVFLAHTLDTSFGYEYLFTIFTILLFLAFLISLLMHLKYNKLVSNQR